MEALDAVRKIVEVKVAAAATGPHNMIALVEAPDVPQLGELVQNKFQTAACVASTLTCVVVRLVGDSLRC